MTIEADVALLFRGVSNITGAVSGKTVGVYAVVAPQKGPTSNATIDPPYIVVTDLSTDYHNTIEATGGVATGVKTATLDIDCKGVTPHEAGLIKKQVELFFDDYTGAAGDSVIEAVELDDSGSSTEAPQSGQGMPVCVKTIDAEVIYY